MATLTADIDATTRLIPTDAGIGYYQVDDELIHLVAPVPPLVPFTDPPTGFMVAEGMGDGGPDNPRKALAGTTAATHSSGATLTRYYPDAAAAAAGAPEAHAASHEDGGADELDLTGLPGAGGLDVLGDPGNVWEAVTPVVEGYRIAETIEGELRVWEVTVAGTTENTAAFTDYEPLDLTPLGQLVDGTVTWTYLGIVGLLPWDVMPITSGLPDNWAIEAGTQNITITSPEDVTAYEYMLRLNAMDGVTPVAVAEITTTGDSDFHLYDSGTSWRWHDIANASEIASIGMDAFYVRSQAADTLFHVNRDTGNIRMQQLPTADPTLAGALWIDTAAGRVLKVSAG